MDFYQEIERRSFLNLTNSADKLTMGFLAKAQKSRMKIRIKKLFLGKALWRTLLVAAMIYTLAGSWFSSAPQEKALNVMDSETGMGGGINPIEANMDFTEISEPGEFSMTRMLTFTSYTMQRGDIIGNIAMHTGLNEDTLVSVNNVRNTRSMQIGQVLKIPNQDGIYYTVKQGDTLGGIAERYKTTASEISIVNELFSDKLAVNANLFIPGARMDWVNRQEINGDLFIWPTSGRISSGYGYRIAPFGRTRQFHSGIDIAAPTGTPVRAAMSGRVIQVGTNDPVWGHFIVVSHHSGYRTFYSHLSRIRTRAGAYVATGERIGDIGSTGLSTGPHLHFSVFKNGVSVNPTSLMRR